MNVPISIPPGFAALVLEHTPPMPILVLGVLLAMAVTVLSLIRYVENFRKAWILPLLRILFFILLFWCLLLPGTRETATRRIRPRFVVMLDTSSSMTLSPPESESVRWDIATNALQKPWMEGVRAQADIDLYPFSTRLEPRRDPEEVSTLSPDGETTLLREALENLIRRYAGLDVGGLLLLSDGLDTREANNTWASALDLPFPVYTLRLDPDDPELWQSEPDLRVDSIDTPRRVTKGWKTELKALISGFGTEGQPLDIDLFRDGELYRRQTIQLPAEGGSREAPFELEHPEMGFFNYTVLANPLPRESNTNDNAFTVSIQVITDRNHLLYLEGPPRWESRYLTRVLRRNSQVTPLVFLRGPGGRFMTLGERGSMTPDMQPEQLAFFKIVILGDLSAEELGDERAANLVRYVENGGSLILLGGTKGWSPTGFLASPLKTLLPLRSHGPQIREGNFAARLTDSGLTHPAFAGDPEFWQSLPPVLSILPEAALTPGASTLVEAHTPAGTFPLIVVQRYGQGRVAAVLSDSLWHWQLGASGLEQQPYRRFWDQLIAWMTPREKELDEESLEIFANREQLFIGDTLEINARSGDSDSGVEREIICEITGPDRRTLPFTMQREQAEGQGAAPGNERSWYTTTFEARQPGLHTALAVMESGGERRESSPISFFVKPYTPETIPGPADSELLETLAARSNGRFFPDIASLQDALSRLDFTIREEELSEYRTYWQHGLVLAALMALLVAEWILRKLKNMP